MNPVLLRAYDKLEDVISKDTKKDYTPSIHTISDIMYEEGRRKGRLEALVLLKNIINNKIK